MVNDEGTFVYLKSIISEISVYSYGVHFFDLDAGIGPAAPIPDCACPNSARSTTRVCRSAGGEGGACHFQSCSSLCSPLSTASLL